MTNPLPRYITTAEQLRQLCHQLADSPWLAIDTEFLRESTYYPRFCLLQIATRDVVACIDPLKLSDLAPLWRLIYRPEVTKVFHAAFQDLEIFHHLHGRLPQPIFDTQIAAPLLGFPEQIGYAQLAEEILGVQLPKSHSRTDWCRRPLTPEQLDYAADDVRHLGPLYLAIRQRLERLGRLEWLADDFARLTDPKAYANPPEEAWRRIKGARRLRGRQLTVLKRLAAWREATAQRENLPRGWVIKDDILCHIARLQPSSVKALSQLRGLGDKTLKRYGQAICAQVVAAEGETHQPSSFRPPERNPEQEALLDLLSAVVRLQAARQQIHPSVLASRRDLERFLDDPATSRLCQGWRRRLIGENLLAFVQGRLSLRVVGNQLQLESVTP